MHPVQIEALLAALESELKFSYSRSSGPGGQNVNKVNTRVTLHWSFINSRFLDADSLKLLKKNSQFLSLVNKQGILSLQEQGSRSQEQNRVRAIAKWKAIMRRALTPPKKRHRTKIPRGTKESRLRSKRMTSERKRMRSKNEYD